MTGTPLPDGTVTFLFTDIEGSTRRWDQFRAAMDAALARHDELLGGIVAQHGGLVFKTVGDAVCAVFRRADDAAHAALEAQRLFQGETWESVSGLPVRVALHTGTVEVRELEYVGPTVNRVAQLVGLAHGGQILVSQATADLLNDNAEFGSALVDLGEHRLKDLPRPEHVYQLTGNGLVREFPPLRSLDWHPNNLPTQLTTLLGRDRELTMARELILGQGVRLLTLTGPGGVGKTHLAAQIAFEVLHQLEDGVFWVNLAAIGDPALVMPAIASTLGIPERGGLSAYDSVVSSLREKRMLLILDNSEQVLGAATEIGALLSACSRLHVLVTSRALLRLHGEYDLAVEPLPVPPQASSPVGDLLRYDSVNLFQQRARAVRPSFALTAANAEAVVELCRRLDGLPLAIELAAAQVRLLTPQATLSWMDRAGGSSSRLRVIGQGPRDLPERHLSLDASIAWSYDLLEPCEQVLFRRLAVFVGSSGLSGVERVCGCDTDVDVIDTLSSLVDKSLVRVDELGPEPRYYMLETIRTFALEKLDESGDEPWLRVAHRDYVVELCEDTERRWWGPAQRELLELLDFERENVRAVLRSTLEQGEPGTGLRVAASIWRYWEARGRLQEGREWFERLLAVDDPSVSDDVRAKALSGLGILEFRQGYYDLASEHQGKSLALRRAIGAPRGIAMSLSHLGDIARQQGRLEEARAHYEESLSLRRSVNYHTGIAISLTKLGLVARVQGRLDEAHRLLEEALAMHRAQGNRSWEAAVLNYLGRVAFYRGEPERARELHAQSLQIRQETGERWEMAMVLSHLGDAELMLGNTDQARTSLLESLRHWNELGDDWGRAYAIETLAYLAHHQQDLERAVTLLAASHRIRERLHTPASPAGEQRIDTTLTQCREALGASEVDRLWNDPQRTDAGSIVRTLLGR